jgi:hypothetical protein
VTTPVHGRIVEDQGVNAVSPEYGRYEYSIILQRFADHGFVVVSEARAPNTDPEAYAETVANQIRHLVDFGRERQPHRRDRRVERRGDRHACSTQVATPVRYVLMANCSDFVFQTFSLSLHGHVLSIYEASDELDKTCEPLFERVDGTRRAARDSAIDRPATRLPVSASRGVDGTSGRLG